MRKFRIVLSFLFLITGMVLMPRLSLAAEYDLKELTSDVKTALENRRVRFEQLRAYKEKGVIGENNHGYVEFLTRRIHTEGGLYMEASHDYDLEDDSVAKVKALVEAENQDRRLIYKTIIQQNNLIPGELEKVEKAFAQVQKDKANPGDKIQDADGNWVTKS